MLLAGIVHASENQVTLLLGKVEASLSTNPKLAENLVTQAHELIRTENLPALKPRLLNLQAHLHTLSWRFTDAYAKASEAQRLAEELHNQLQLAEALRRQGIINNLLEMDADAIDLLTRSLRIHQSLNSQYLLNNLQALGNVYTRDDNWVDSLIDIGKQLVEKSIEFDNQYFQEQGYSFVASGMIKKGNYQQASDLTQRVLEELKQEHGEINYYAALANLKLGDLETAMQHRELYNGYARQRKTAFFTVAATLLKAEILVQYGNESAGLQMLLDGYRLAKNNRITDYQEEALLQLAHFYHAQSNYQKAYEYKTEYIQLKEAAFNSLQSKQLAFSRERLELEQKNQAIARRQDSAYLNQQQTHFQLLTIVLMAVIAILTLVLYWRVTKQKRLLQAYSSELKHANEAKFQLFARMSHEIRTPINAIIGLTKLTQKQTLTKPQQNRNLRQIEESSITLLGVINDILDFSKIEAGKLHIDSAPFELHKVMDQATCLHMHTAQEKKLELVQCIARDVPLYLQGDALRVQQVLNNLINNAVKFTSTGMVSISVTKQYSSAHVLLEFAVKDTGIGLSEEQVSRLFESFSQADDATSRQFNGTGPGLAICKQLVELMGGEIRVESQRGSGSTFYFTIEVDEAKVTHPEKEVPGTSLPDLRVLVVDDLDMCRKAAAEVLLRVNSNPDLVDSGAKAIEKVRLSMQDKTPYDLVLLDWHMPDTDGIQVASILNQEFAQTRPAIVMLSSYDINELQDLGAAVGIKHYLEKPITISKLTELISQITQENALKMAPESSVSAVQENIVPNLKGKRILLVEDNKLNRKVVISLLSETHAHLTVAKDGALALQQLQDNSFDAVLMDIRMPNMDGLTAIRKIRQELGLKLPIIVMTGSIKDTEIDNAVNGLPDGGVAAYVTKPIDSDALYGVINKILYADNNVAQQPVNTNNLDEDMGPELIKLTQIDKARAISKLHGKVHLYEGLVKDFIAMQDHIQKLEMALEEGDIKNVKLIVHTYKSGLAYVGAFALATLGKQLDATISADETELHPDLIARVRLYINAITHITESFKSAV